MLVACVLSVVTQGMGTSEWLAEGTATNAALSSGIQTLAASAGTALAANLGDLSKAFDELTSAAAFFYALNMLHFTVEIALYKNNSLTFEM